jgi:hypothetical protein
MEHSEGQYDDWFKESHEYGYGIDEYLLAKTRNKKKGNAKTYVVITEESSTRFSGNQDKGGNGSCFLRNNSSGNNLYRYRSENHGNSDLWEEGETPLCSNFSQFSRNTQNPPTN